MDFIDLPLANDDAIVNVVFPDPSNGSEVDNRSGIAPLVLNIVSPLHGCIEIYPARLEVRLNLLVIYSDLLQISHMIFQKCAHPGAGHHEIRGWMRRNLCFDLFSGRVNQRCGFHRVFKNFVNAIHAVTRVQRKGAESWSYPPFDFLNLLMLGSENFDLRLERLQPLKAEMRIGCILLPYEKKKRRQGDQTSYPASNRGYPIPRTRGASTIASGAKKGSLRKPYKPHDQYRTKQYASRDHDDHCAGGHAAIPIHCLVPPCRVLP
jgi:hypothetical protein